LFGGFPQFARAFITAGIRPSGGEESIITRRIFCLILHKIGVKTSASEFSTYFRATFQGTRHFADPVFGAKVDTSDISPEQVADAVIENLG